MGDAGVAREILPGFDVRDARDDLVGTVIEAAPSYVLVEQGRFFPDDVYLPIEATATIEPGVVRLALTGQEALDRGWHVAPPVGAGFLATDTIAPGIPLAGHVEELGTTEDDPSTDADMDGTRPTRSDAGEDS